MLQLWKQLLKRNKINPSLEVVNNIGILLSVYAKFSILMYNVVPSYFFYREREELCHPYPLEKL